MIIFAARMEAFNPSQPEWDDSRPLLIVTGASGFIGNRYNATTKTLTSRMCCILVDELKASGKDPKDCPLVVGIVRNYMSSINSGYFNLTENHVLSLDRQYFRLCYADLSNKEAVDRIIQGEDLPCVSYLLQGQYR